jgi:hypothetical protein
LSSLVPPRAAPREAQRWLRAEIKALRGRASRTLRGLRHFAAPATEQPENLPLDLRALMDFRFYIKFFSHGTTATSLYFSSLFFHHWMVSNIFGVPDGLRLMLAVRMLRYRLLVRFACCLKMSSDGEMCDFSIFDLHV